MILFISLTFLHSSNLSHFDLPQNKQTKNKTKNKKKKTIILMIISTNQKLFYRIQKINSVRIGKNEYLPTSLPLSLYIHIYIYILGWVDLQRSPTPVS